MIVNGPSNFRQACRGAAWFNHVAGVGAGRAPEFIEMMQVAHDCWSGSARGTLGIIPRMLKYIKWFLATVAGYAFAVAAHAMKPHRLALDRMGVRVVAFTERRREKEELCEAAYKALTLLEHYDKQMYIQVTQLIRVVFLVGAGSTGYWIPAGRVYSVSAHAVPHWVARESLPLKIAGSLAWQVALAKCDGGLAYFDKAKGLAVCALCRSEREETVKNLKKAVA
jgi:hypothetical protein